MRAFAKAQARVTDAIETGAHVMTGSRPLEGLFFKPTVLTGVKPGMLVMNFVIDSANRGHLQKGFGFSKMFFRLASTGRSATTTR